MCTSYGPNNINVLYIKTKLQQTNPDDFITKNSIVQTANKTKVLYYYIIHVRQRFLF